MFARRAREDARLLLCWLIVPIAFLTPSGSKLPAYLLPCFGAVAILAAAGLERGRRGPLAACAVTLMALVVAGFVLGPAALTRAIGVHGASAPLPLAAVAALGVLGSGGIVMLRGPAVAALLVLIGWVALVFAARPYESALGSPRPLADVLIENSARGRARGRDASLRRRRAVLSARAGAAARRQSASPTFTPEERRAALLIDRDGLRALLDHHDRVWLLAPRDEGRALATSLGLEYARTTMWRDETLGTITRAEPLPR